MKTSVMIRRPTSTKGNRQNKWVATKIAKGNATALDTEKALIIIPIARPRRSKGTLSVIRVNANVETGPPNKPARKRKANKLDAFHDIAVKAVVMASPVNATMIAGLRLIRSINRLKSKLLKAEARV